LDIVGLHESLVSNVQSTLVFLSGAAMIILLAGCANVAGLLAARSTARGREVAIKAALGAGRMVLIRQLLTESILLGVGGGAMGILFAYWAVTAITHTTAFSLQGFESIHVDVPVLIFAIAVSLGSGMAFGLAPAVAISRQNLVDVLAKTSRSFAGVRPRRSARGLLVMFEAGFCVVLLIGAGLLVQSFRQVLNVSLGFNPHQALTMHIALPSAKYPDDARRTAFVREAIDALQSIPGVASATASVDLPLSLSTRAPFLAEGQRDVPGIQRPLAQWNPVTPGYFRTLGICLISGRDFTWADNANSPRVLVVSESLARRFWPNESALGKQIIFTRLQLPHEVIGVVGDVKNQGLEQDSSVVVYTPYAQRARPSMAVTIRTIGDPRSVWPVARKRLAAVDPDQPVTGVSTLDDVFAVAVSCRRETMFLIGGFAVVAMLLAIIGLYGLMSSSVTQRTNEIAIRQALGAESRDIMRIVLSQAVRLAGTGIAVGILAALALARPLSGLLFNVSATDPFTYIGISLLFMLIALIASAFPAIRATRISTVEALRL
jgi:putative ABC transport system permease protein